MANGQGIFDRINRYQLDPELLRRALEAIANMDAEDRKSFEARAITIIRFVHGKDMPDDECTDAAMSINFRLMALAKFDVPAFPVWRIVAEGKDDPDLLHDDVVQCAAEEPLVRDGEDLSFDRARFTCHLADITARRIAVEVNQAASSTHPA